MSSNTCTHVIQNRGDSCGNQPASYQDGIGEGRQNLDLGRAPIENGVKLKRLHFGVGLVIHIDNSIGRLTLHTVQQWNPTHSKAYFVKERNTETETGKEAVAAESEREGGLGKATKGKRKAAQRNRKSCHPLKMLLLTHKKRCCWWCLLDTTHARVLLLVL